MKKKLTHEFVLHIRQKAMPGIEYAKLYGVDKSTISCIQNNHTRWCGSIPSENVASYPRMTLKERIEKWTMPEPNTGCWIWTGNLNTNGYGIITVSENNEKKTTLVHRLYYSILKAPIPDNLCVCHRCDNPLCVNPDHMFLGTKQDNIRDRDNKGRVQRGQKHVHARLLDVYIPIIREAYKTGFSLVKISRYFNVTANSLSPVINRKSWKHIA